MPATEFRLIFLATGQYWRLRIFGLSPQFGSFCYSLAKLKQAQKLVRKICARPAPWNKQRSVDSAWMAKLPWWLELDKEVEHSYRSGVIIFSQLRILESHAEL